MGFSKERARGLLMLSFSIFLIVQQVVIRYGRSYRSRAEHNKLIVHEVSELQKIWRKAAVHNIITPEKIANPTELKLARARLKEAQAEIQNSERQVKGVTGEEQELFQKAYAYYQRSASALLAIVDFLLAKERKFSVNGNQVDFESNDDSQRFLELVNQLSYLQQEKQNLDALISYYNK